MKKYIIVAGGVMSGVGKGIATASIARILKEYGFRTTAVKIDPYINYDAGTLRPTEHGEVWVTDDGGEIDQDLGSYERFLGENIPKRNNITTGQIYKTIIDRERRGEYLGKTVQFIPHVPDEIKRRVKLAARGYEITLVEIGGTIGDYENIPFLFAMKSLEREIGKQNVLYILLTYLPIPSHIPEMKTKPTQQAIKALSEHGIFPDIILCRAKKPLDSIRKKKIETYANIEAEYVISAPDVKTVYEVPLNFEKEGLGRKILKKLRLRPRKEPDWTRWRELVERILNPSRKIRVAMIGKYVEIGDYTLPDSYISVNQAIEHAGAWLDTGVEIEWIDADSLLEKGTSILSDFHGIVVPGGFGTKGTEGKIAAIEYARKNKVPYLGLCFGMQLAVIEYARNVAGLKGANSTEIDPETPHPVIDLMPSQKRLLKKKRYGGTMRLGAYAAVLKEKTRVMELYKERGRIEKDMERAKELEKKRLGIIHGGEKFVLERHRHRYEVNPEYAGKLEENGLVFSGFHRSLNGEILMEYIELPGHPFFVATQSHPEFLSRLEDPSPVFLGFIKACLER